MFVIVFRRLVAKLPEMVLMLPDPLRGMGAGPPKGILAWGYGTFFWFLV